MPAFEPIRFVPTVARTVIAIVAAVLGGAAACAQGPAARAPIESLVGRWSGSGFVRGVDLAPGSPIVLDVRACGDRLCARTVRPDGACGETLIEIEARSPSPEGAHLAQGTGTHRGRMVRAGLPAAELALTHVAAAPDRPAELHVRESAVPLYSRRLPDVVNLSLRYQGATACEAKPTS